MKDIKNIYNLMVNLLKFTSNKTTIYNKFVGQLKFQIILNVIVY